MISRIVRFLFTIAVVALAVFVVLNRNTYKSLIPEEYDPWVLITKSLSGEEATQSNVELLDIEPAVTDTLEMSVPQEMADTLQRDTLK